MTKKEEERKKETELWILQETDDGKNEKEMAYNTEGQQQWLLDTEQSTDPFFVTQAA